MKVVFYEHSDSSWRMLEDELDILETHRAQEIPSLLETAEKR